MRDGEDVLRRPVEGESGGKVVTEEEKDERHQHEDALLHFVSGLRSDLHLQDHRDGHEEGKGVDGETHDVGDGVGLGEIGDPPEEGLVAELDGILKHGEEAEEDGDLQEHGKATAHRVDSELAIELHCLLIHLVRIVGILLLELGHLGLELRHPLHSAGGLGVQGPHQGADNESQDDHGPSPGPIVALAAEEGRKLVEGPVENVTDPAEEPVVHDFGLVSIEAANEEVIFRSDKDIEFDDLGALSHEGFVGEGKVVVQKSCAFFFFGAGRLKGDFLWADPDGGGVGIFRRNDGGKELVFYAAVLHFAFLGFTILALFLAEESSFEPSS